MRFTIRPRPASTIVGAASLDADAVARRPHVSGMIGKLTRRVYILSAPPA
ncbi:MAG TPA: hypothetical protein VF983_12360 [Streptosporangiaceae bacterium]